MKAEAHDPRHHRVGMRELSQRTARVLALVRAGETGRSTGEWLSELRGDR